MTDTTHSITPPPELVQQWVDAWNDPKIKDVGVVPYVATQAARWGADQELEACIGWLDRRLFDRGELSSLRSSRRPKPPSLKEQALRAIGVPTKIGEARVIEHHQHELIRRALEALPND